MKWFRKQADSDGDPKSAEEFCRKLIAGFKEKSSHNKNESMLCFWFSMGGALAAPLFVTLGDDLAAILGQYGSEFIFSKLVPSVLSVSVAFSTAWLQLRKPQHLWALYRTSQRELENHLYKYQFGFAEYEDHPDPEKLLAENSAKVALDAHYAWLPMVPNPEDMKSGAPVRAEE